MKKNRFRNTRLLSLLIVLTVTAAALAGCGKSAGSSSSQSVAYEADYDYAMAPAEAAAPTAAMGSSYNGYNDFGTEIALTESAYESVAEKPAAPDQAEAAGGPTGAESAVPGDSRKLIKTVSLEAETGNLYALDQFITQKVAALGGYIESSNKYSKSRGYQDPYYATTESDEDMAERSRWTSADYTLRIPADRLDEFVADVDSQANVTSQYNNVDDVTLRYVDMESRRNSLRTEQTRLLELLEQAETIEDVISIEDRLTDVRYELESMESQLRAMDNQIRYSTVHLNIRQVTRFTVVDQPKGAGERITQGFLESVDTLTYNLREFCIWFIIKIPFILVWILVCVIAFLVIRALIRASEQTPEKRERRRRIQLQKQAEKAAKRERKLAQREAKKTEKQNKEDRI